jgi:hypothetical protein
MNKMEHFYESIPGGVIAGHDWQASPCNASCRKAMRIVAEGSGPVMGHAPRGVA